MPVTIPTPPPFIVVRKDQLQASARVLAEAFVDYPLYTLAIRNPRKRLNALQGLFEVLNAYTINYGTIIATSDQLEGVLCYLPRNATSITISGMLRSGAIKLPLKLGFPALFRLNSLTVIHEPLQAKHASFPHTYILNLGVKPDQKGRGYAGRLVRYLLQELATRNEPCYLETALEGNVRLYQHLGFKLVETHENPKAHFTTWAMLWKNT